MSWGSGFASSVRYSEQFRTPLSTYRAGSVIVSILRTRCKMVGDMSMSTCWACGGAPPSWSFVCEECGGRGISSKSEHERMETLERDYWRGSWGNTAIHFVAALLSWASLPQRSLTRSSFVVDRLNSNGFAKLVQDLNRLIVQFLRLGDICGEQPSRGQGA